MKKKKQIREPDHDFFEVKGDVRRLVFNQSCSSNTNRLVSFMVWITNLLLLPFSFSPFIQPSVGHFGNLISSHEVLPKCMKGEERKGKDSWLTFQPLTGHWRPNFSRTGYRLDLRSPWEVVNGWKSSRNLYSLSSSTHSRRKGNQMLKVINEWLIELVPEFTFMHLFPFHSFHSW